MPPIRGADAVLRLRMELARLQHADPFQALGIPPTGGAEEVRNAFLEATKVFHPNKFAAGGVEVRDLASEVFLLIKRAYEQLADETRRKQWQEKLRPAKPGPAPQATGQRSTGPGPLETGGRGPTTTPGATPPATNPVTSPSPSSSAATSSTPPAPSPPGKDSAPAGSNPPGATPGARAPSTSRPAGKGRTTLPGSRVPNTRPPQEVAAMLEAARTRSQRFEDALKTLAQGNFKAAREALHRIAAEDPHSKRYRVQLHYAWGMEHKIEGRAEAAVREFERAVALDPEFADAASELKKLQEQKKGTSILSKLFGR
ncbi:MAG: DnaJ domain-containing protein [Deltaproteobacteria bacterium]|nr:DnaJ domain-containing protein [Deltaproteobacteria bacterium]